MYQLTTLHLRAHVLLTQPQEHVRVKPDTTASEPPPLPPPPPLTSSFVRLNTKATLDRQRALVCVLACPVTAKRILCTRTEGGFTECGDDVARERARKREIRKTSTT
uniref:Uncharacterized protein n=1 Tax=Mesocestoides corti TaxID=53468 RepID=A0A5K3FR58_MESCO